MVSRERLGDLMAVCGVALLAIAAGLVYLPAAIAVLGVGLILGAVAIALEDGR